MKLLFIIIAMFIVYLFYTVVVAIWQNTADRLGEYNAHVCAVYGKMPDCKTELPKMGGEL